MSTPRRNIVRQTPALAVVSPQDQHRLQRVRSRLEQERVSHSRWMARLKRAFHAIEKSQARLARLERQLARQEQPS